MTLREVLQIEIWSKQTTLRVLSALPVLVVGIAIVYLVGIYWISPTERSTGREALVSIEKLNPLLGGGEEQYRIADSEANAKVEIAQRSTWTLRDRNINSLLSVYLGSIENEAKLRESSLTSIASKDERKQRMLIETTAKLLDGERQLTDQLGQTLHRVLD